MYIESIDIGLKMKIGTTFIYSSFFFNFFILLISI